MKNYDQLEEYLRRNIEVAKCVGALSASAKALERVKSWAEPRLWLVRSLQAAVERLESCKTELVRHRDEVKPPDDWYKERAMKRMEMMKQQEE